MLVLTVYFGLGAIVLLSRLLAPRPRRKAGGAGCGAASEIQPQVPLSENDADQYALPMAA